MRPQKSGKGKEIDKKHKIESVTFPGFEIYHRHTIIKRLDLNRYINITTEKSLNVIPCMHDKIVIKRLN